MEGLGVAANVIAVIDLSAKVTSACAAYLKAVKNAKADIERLQSELGNLDVVLRGAESLVKGPNASKLQTMEQLKKALFEASSQLRRLIIKLEDKMGKTHRVMSRLGFRALKWPFQSSEVDSIIRGLEKSRNNLSVALAIDNTTLHIETHSVVQHIGRTLDMSRIPVAKGAAFDSQTNEHDPMCLPNTRVELRQTITTWAEDPYSDTIFWLNGMAGTGKSTISRTIAHSFSQKRTLGASFFFKRGERDRGNASRLFTTLAAQLITRLPEIGPSIIKAVETEPDLPNKFIQEQFEKLIFDPLHELEYRMSAPRVFVLVIDALDECDRLADVRLIINILTRLRSLTSIKLKAFVTSRPELPIRLGFNSIKGKYRDLILHEIPKPIIEHDISEFFHHQLEQARLEYNGQSDPRGQLGPEWPGTHATKALIQMAIPLFIFAATICRFIQDPLYDPLTQLDKVLRYKSSAQDSEMQKLDTTYRPTLDQLIAGRTGRAKENLLTDFRDVVGAIVLLAEPLSISSLSRLIGISEQVIHGILRHLHSVLNVPNSSREPVRMLHLSFHDFLVDKEMHATDAFWVDEQDMHDRIATKCLDLLCSGRHLKQDICDLDCPGTRRADIKQEDVNLKLPDQVRYACLYWTHHIEARGLKIADSHPAFGFLKGYFLFWLEALAILGEAHNCSAMIASIQSLVDPKRGSGLSSFLRDATRFVTRLDTVIDQYPLQIYASGLVFAPEESIIKTAFRECIPEWITQLPQVQQNWDASLRVIEVLLDGKSEMCFLPDSRSLQTASSDGVVQVWDTMTGKQIDNVKTHGVHQMMFSRDGEWSISTGYDRTIMFWVTPAGTFEHHFDESIECLALSPDGKLAACASFNGPTLIAEHGQGEAQRRSYGKGGGAPQIALSPNGKLLAVARDGVIQLWDLDSDQKTVKFPIGQGIWRILFSPNSRLIACAQSGWAVVHDVGTGRILQKLGGDPGWVSAIAFAPDSRHLASASGRTVRLWNLAAGKEVQRFEHPCDNVMNMAFSPDGSLLAASSPNQGMILLWDPTTKNDSDGSSEHGGSIRCLAPSRDGDQVATISEDGSVGIWDLDTAQNIGVVTRSLNEKIIGVFFSQWHRNHVWMVFNSNTIKCYDFALGRDVDVDHVEENRTVSRVAMSPDGNNLALYYLGGAKIWDLSERRIRHTLETIGTDSLSTGNIMMSVVSTNGTMLASITYGLAVTIWDLTSGRPKQRLTVGHHDHLRITLSALSLHDSTLGVAFFLYNTPHTPWVTLWDINTAACVSRIRVDDRVNYMEFNATGSHIITELGEVKIPPPHPHDLKPEEPGTHQDFEGYGATGNFAWITWKSGPIMWLPPSHRPSMSFRTQRLSLFNSSTAILGAVSGNLSILKFVETPPWESRGRVSSQGPLGWI